MGQSPGLPLSSSTHYLVELDGENLDLDRLEEAWNRLIQHHEMMRAVVDNEGQQRILSEVPIQRIERSHVRQHRGEDSAVAAQQYLHECWRRQSSTGNSAAQWPPFEVHAVGYGNQRHRIGILLDYLTLDGYSIKLLLEQLARLYADPQAALPVLGISFRDYVLQVQPSAQARARSEAYWRERLADLPLAPALPLAAEPASLSQPQFTRRQVRIPREQWTRLQERARENNITPSVLLLVAYSQVIRRWSSGADFTLNLTLFDRQDVHPDVGALLGDFTSLAPVAFREANGAGLLDQARSTQLEIAAALEHREISSIWVQRERARDTSLVAAALPVVFTSTLGLGGGLFEAPAPGFLNSPQGDSPQHHKSGWTISSMSSTENSPYPGTPSRICFRTACSTTCSPRTSACCTTWSSRNGRNRRRFRFPPQVAVRAGTEQSLPASTVTLLHAGMFAMAVQEPERPALIVEGLRSPTVNWHSAPCASQLCCGTAACNPARPSV